jgi:hypothetical protein
MSYWRLNQKIYTNVTEWHRLQLCRAAGLPWDAGEIQMQGDLYGLPILFMDAKMCPYLSRKANMAQALIEGLPKILYIIQDSLKENKSSNNCFILNQDPKMYMLYIDLYTLSKIIKWDDFDHMIAAMSRNALAQQIATLLAPHGQPLILESAFN